MAAGDQGPVEALTGLLGLGFTGYWIDTFGYDETALDELRRELARELRVHPITSPDGRFLFYDLRPAKERLNVSDAELRGDAAEQFGI
jgi:hypothetical protein